MPSLDELSFKECHSRRLTPQQCVQEEIDAWSSFIRTKDAAKKESRAASSGVEQTRTMASAWEALISLLNGYNGRAEGDKRAYGIVRGGPGGKF